MNYTVLLDTNILIPLEDSSKRLPFDFAELKRLLGETRCQIFVHPAQLEDLQRDTNESRRKIVLSRIKGYSLLQDPPSLTEEALRRMGWKQNNNHDKVDNELLYASYCGAVHFLVTNDKGILRKARNTKLQSVVYNLSQFIAFLLQLKPPKVKPPAGIGIHYLYRFPVDQPFFDSLRSAYLGFDDWYNRVAKERRQAWCLCEGSTVYGICIFKEEDHPSIVEGGAPLDGNALKLCTFKIGEQLRGRKYGERLLYCAFQYALEKNIKYVYLHTYGPEQRTLLSLCSDFGFQGVGQYKRDFVLLKKMTVEGEERLDLTPLEYVKRFYPHYRDDGAIRKFIVPILPRFHEDLFSDVSDIADGLFKDRPEIYSPQSNCIKKAYICCAKTNQLEAGDLLFFYRTHDRCSIECVGVVESATRESAPGRIQALVAKRTVFSETQLTEIARANPLIILFRHVKSFPPITLQDLRAAGVKGAIQSIRRLTEEQYERLFRDV